MIVFTYTYDVSRILPDGQMWVKETQWEIEGGEVLEKKYHRHVISPGDSLVGEHGTVVAVANLIHTPAVVEAFQVAHPVGGG